MADQIVHRGPDDSGAWVDCEAGIALGSRRLAIVDLSPAGHQPMLSSCGRYVIAFNGEVYNFLDLRRELEPKGHSFRGHSDTEVMLEAIREWGLEAAVKKFVGMFAFALWDRRERALHLVRDRLGIKPLYYGSAGKVFLFGSELKALRAHPDFVPAINRDALALLMRHNYIPQPYSIYQGIFKLPPGCLLTIKTRHSAPPVHALPVPYWSAKEVAESGAANPFLGSAQEARDQLDALLRDSVRLRMIADVPLGAFLSGGVDSSAVVALMQAQSNRPVKTFTIGFYEENYNEAPHAKAVAGHLGTEHTELYVTPEEARAVIPKLPVLFDEPFSDSSQIPTHLISALARRQVTVSLSGDGGDELFGGYPRYTLARSLWKWIGWMPRALRRRLAPIVSGLAHLITARDTASSDPAGASYDRALGWLAPWSDLYGRPGPMGGKTHKLAEVLALENREALYRYIVSGWKRPVEIVLGAQEPATILTDSARWANLPDFFQRMMFLDLVSYLPDDILTKVDRASMGVSLEARVPILDHRVVEFAARLPSSMKICHGQGKWLLRQVLYQYVPRELIERPKMGFGVPIDAWLRGPLRDWAEELLSEGRLRREGYFHPEPIRSRWAEHLSGQRNWDYCLWDVLVFQAWLEHWSRPGRGWP
jgi:asparagine synthase (glutamine-hydrolysing)